MSEINRATKADNDSVDEHEKRSSDGAGSTHHEPVAAFEWGPDDIVPGSENVTFREMDTLRHVSDKINFGSFLVIIVEFAERWSYYGTLNVVANFVRAPKPCGSRDGHVPKGCSSSIAGALGKGQQKAFVVRTFNNFWFYVTPFIGGIAADTLLGRYKAILYFCMLYLVGHIILVAAATPSVLDTVETSYGLLWFAIVIMGIGGGAIKANVSPMIAEQYTGKMRTKTLKSGEVVIISPAATYQSIYQWFYASINFGSCGAISASFIARDHGYWQAFLVPTCILAVVPLVLGIGKKSYIVTPPRGSILLEVMRVLGMCFRGNFSANPVTTWRNFRSKTFYDTARPSRYTAGQVPKKITWDDEFVDEVDRALKACAVFTVMPFFWLCYSQIDNNLLTVAASMRLDGTPNDLIQNLNPIIIITFIPVMEVVYPALRRVGIFLTPIKRMAIGFFFTSSAMIFASVLQNHLYKASPCYKQELYHMEPAACAEAAGGEDPPPYAGPVDLSVWAVAGPYMLIGIGEIFSSITANEYAYTKSPKRMKSTVMAVQLFMNAISSALNFALTDVNVEKRFQWLFASFAIVSALAGSTFYLMFRGVDKEEFHLSVIGVGDRQGFKNETADVTAGLHHVGEEKLGARHTGA